MIIFHFVLFMIIKFLYRRYFKMSKVCVICGKRPNFGNSVSHSNKKVKRVFKPNIIKTKIELNGKVKNANVCTKCLKAGKAKKIV